jgi:hypothetical protein
VDPSAIAEYCAERGVPENFAWPQPPDAAGPLQTVELVGTVQAGNRAELHILVGGLVLRLPTEAVLGIGDAPAGPRGSSWLIVDTAAVAEARTRMLLLPELREDIRPLVLDDPQTILENATYTDETLKRFEDIVERLKGMGLPVPLGTDGGTSTYSYLSSAISTPSPDGGRSSDSDPIRTADD